MIEEVAVSVCSAGIGCSVVRQMRGFGSCRGENDCTVVVIVNSFLGEMHDTLSRKLVYLSSIDCSMIAVSLIEHHVPWSNDV